MKPVIADPTSPTIVASVRDEMEAAEIVSALADHGIRAAIIGEFSSGFRAEAPGDVKVVVQQVDVTRAKKILADFVEDCATIDWSTVDFTDDPLCPDEIDRQQPRRCQFSIRTLMALQTCACIGLAIWKGLPSALLMALVLAGGTLALIAVGTVAVASDLTRARQAWRYVGSALIVGFFVLVLISLIRIL
ncbi:MAG: hypothetical protein JW829_17510 [Pirellulales bacterium]|nr:hypothetical protein [Pirellulales bacterium]